MTHEPAAATCYLAEIFLPRRNPERVTGAAERVRTAAEALKDSDVVVRHLESLFVPSEETAFYLFETERADAVERVLRDAGLEAERISPAIVQAFVTSEAAAELPNESGRSER